MTALKLWSLEKEKCFLLCQRRYFFDYHFSRGVSAINTGPSRRTDAAALAALRPRQVWAASTLQERIERNLQAIFEGQPPISQDDELLDVANAMRSQFRESRLGAYWEKSERFGLFEHEYDLEVDDSEWRELINTTCERLRIFRSLPIYDYLLRYSTRHWLGVGLLAEFPLQTAACTLKIDFAERKRDSVELHLFNSGLVTDEPFLARKILHFVLGASNLWNIPTSKIKVTEWKLTDGTSVQHAFTQYGLDTEKKRLEQVLSTVGQLESKLRGGFPQESRFSFTRNQDICFSCNFKKICPKWE